MDTSHRSRLRIVDKIVAWETIKNQIAIEEDRSVERYNFLDSFQHYNYTENIFLCLIVKDCFVFGSEEYDYLMEEIRKHIGKHHVYGAYLLSTQDKQPSNADIISCEYWEKQRRFVNFCRMRFIESRISILEGRG